MAKALATYPAQAMDPPTVTRTLAPNLSNKFPAMKPKMRMVKFRMDPIHARRGFNSERGLGLELELFDGPSP